MDDLLEQFLLEAHDLVQQATDDLLELERNPSDRARLDGAFRAVHTLKGSVGLFDLPAMGKTLHAGEDLLGAIRDGRGSADRATINILLELIGQTERWIGALESTGVLPPDAEDDAAWLTGALRARLPSPAAAPEAERSPGPEAGWAQALLAEASAAAPDLPDDGFLAIRYVPASDCFFTGDDPLSLVRAIPDLVLLRVRPGQPWPPAAEFDPFACNLVIEALTRSPRAAVQALFRLVPDQVSFQEVRSVARSDHQTVAGPEPEASGRAGPASLRVDAKRIDRLVDLVGELVTAKNALSFVAAQAQQGGDMRQLVSGVLSNQAVIERLVADLHAAVMGARMLPVRDALRGLPRAVRDLSIRLGKDVDFVVHGEGVEADKAVVEGLFEPLLHLIRNALDHGIEAEEARREAAKPPRGRIELRVRRHGDKIVIEIADDGRGVDPSWIRQVARDRGLHRDETLAAMSEAELVDLIFSPGFSTAGAVTDVSGRGVGMDAVRTAVERLGGGVSVQSVPGEGTTVRLALPVTVVLTQIMVVRVGAESFGIPIDAVVETARLAPDRVLPLGSGEAFVFRERTLPLVHLSRLLHGTQSDPGGRDLLVMLVSTGSDLVGIAVDGFGERMDIMLRPMAGILAGMPGFAGTALRGDGSVLMILDLPELLG